PAMPIPMGPDRAPVWPPGMVGSITHCPTAVLAAVGWEGEVQMLGLDLEQDEDLDAELWPAVLTNQETDWVREQPDGARWAKRIFSAKEAVYKAQFPVSHTLFDFHALQILFDSEAHGFHAEFQRDVAPFAKGQKIDGHIGLGQGLVLASVVVQANSPGGAGPAPHDLI
ncbi:MAG: 4'-phosphopantetheinyl transferase superfamily protein, partial [Pseudomonadota bacterium]